MSFFGMEDIANSFQIWSLVDPCPLQLKRLVCVFVGYHALHRFGQNLHATQPLSMNDSLRVSYWPSAWTAFSDAFIVEAAEVGLLTCSRFSVPNFLLAVSSDANESITTH